MRPAVVSIIQLECECYLGISEIGCKLEVVTVYNLNNKIIELWGSNNSEEQAREWKNTYPECIYENWGL